MDLITLDEKKVKLINENQKLYLIMALMAVIVFLFYLVLSSKQEYNEHLKQDLVDEKERGKKKDETIEIYRSLGKQFSDFRDIIYKSDTTHKN